MKTKNSLYFLILFGLYDSLFNVNSSFSQSRMVLNNNAYVVVSNNAYLVLDNNATNAISTAGTGGNIISEGEFNRVKWNIGTAIGNYIVPYTNSTGDKLPLSLNITSAGVGSGSILFSSYAGPNWDNNTYRPSDVTNMDGHGVNNSANVVDRFWIIDAIGYTTKPAVSITFYYSDNDWNGAGNTIIESSLFSQRFNAPSDTWGDWYGSFGTADIVNNTVSSGNVNPSDFYRSWTLVNESSPLPVELLSFNANLSENKIKIKWGTASETNNDYFTLERSVDTKNWDAINIVDGAGNSNQIVNYECVDYNPYIGMQYYRLKQTDFNGRSEFSNIISTNFNKTYQFDVNIFPNPTRGKFSIYCENSVPESITIRILDCTGHKMLDEMTLPDDCLNFDISDFSDGIYFVEIYSGGITKKIKLIKNQN